MEDDEIKNIPRFKKLNDDSQNFKALKRAWPLLKPLLNLFNADTKRIEEGFGKVGDISRMTTELVELPDKFNNIFAEHGWIFFEVMEVDTAKEAITIAEKVGIEKADDYLVEHFSPIWFRDRINWLKYIKGFQPRFPIAIKALEDYEVGRYYSSILVTLTLIDGWVNELNIDGFQRLGFFSEKSNLVAWDSITAHPNGLMRLKATFGKSRQITRDDEIRIPYRNGIVHGMDLGYDNKYVAAKCWAALFAVRDWAIKAARNELNAPNTPPEIEKSLWEAVEDFQNLQKKIEEDKIWQPRTIIIGDTIPAKGLPEDYPQNSPEKLVVEFLTYWQKNNYGFMAKCCMPLIDYVPDLIRKNFGQYKLHNFFLLNVNEITPTSVDIDARIDLSIDSEKIERKINFCVVGVKSDRKLADFLSDDFVWCVSIWRIN